MQVNSCFIISYQSLHWKGLFFLQSSILIKIVGTETSNPRKFDFHRNLGNRRKINRAFGWHCWSSKGLTSHLLWNLNTVAYHWKTELASYFYEVFISLFNLWLPCSKMTADKAKTGCMKQHPNCYCTFISSGSSHASLYSINSNIPKRVKHLLNLQIKWHRS